MPFLAAGLPSLPDRFAKSDDTATTGSERIARREKQAALVGR